MYSAGQARGGGKMEGRGRNLSWLLMRALYCTEYLGCRYCTVSRRGLSQATDDLEGGRDST